MNEIKKDIKELEYNFGSPSYNYLNYINTPGGKGVSGDGSMSTTLKDAMALPYWIEVLTLGWGSDGTRNYPNGKGSYNTGGKLGNKYKIRTGWCKDGKTPRWTWIDNVPKCKGPIMDPFDPKKIIEMPTPFYGLGPGLLQDVGTLNPIALFKAASGKGTMLGDCFQDYKEERSNYNTFLVSFPLQHFS